MTSDVELLRRFVEDRSEAAFTELVQLHLPLVRATALRRVGGDAHAADDVTQLVFITLARKASSLRGHATLAGWLYVSTHHATAELVRREQRRKQREASAHSMHLTESSLESPDEAARIRPMLDDALITLKPIEREAIVLRFFAKHTFSEIGTAVKLSEEAARKRVNRALEKLHTVLVRRGVTSTVAVLGSTLTAAGMSSAPTGLAIKVAGVALTKAAAPSVIASVASLLWPAVGAAVIVGGTLAIVPQHRANNATAAVIASREADTRSTAVELKTENQRLSRDITHAKTVVAERAPPTRSLDVRPDASVRTGPDPVSKTVLVTTEGTLKWEGEPVTLGGFLQHLVDYQASAPRGESRLVVQANGTLFSQLNYVLIEARKAGITNLVVESDTLPEGIANTWF